MAKYRLFAVVMAVLASVAAAETTALKPDRPDRYVVQRGDTLWGIAGKYLDEPWRWPEIWEVNPGIANPHLIYPGDTLVLSYKGGRPSLGVQRGRPTVKLSPTVRVTPLERPIPTIPIDAIRPFLTGPRVVSKEALDEAPYVVAPAQEHLVAGSGDRIYVRGLEAGGAGRYSVFRPGDPYRDVLPDSVLNPPPTHYTVGERATAVEPPDADKVVLPAGGPILGYEAIYVGETKLAREGDPATLDLLSTAREVQVGDRLLPVEEETIQQNFLPHPPKSAIENGYIISVYGGVSQIGQHDVVVLNKGERDGIEVGDVLAVYRAGEAIKDPVKGHVFSKKVTLPDERAGEIMVFRVFDRLSYALVMRAVSAIHVRDKATAP